MPAVLLGLLGRAVPAMSERVILALIALVSLLVTNGAQYFGVTAPAKDEAAGRAVAQDQCCPIARTLAEGCAE